MLTRYVAMSALLLPLVVYDLATRGRVHTATLVGGAAHVLQHPLYLLVGSTAGWQALVKAL